MHYFKLPRCTPPSLRVVNLMMCTAFMLTESVWAGVVNGGGGGLLPAHPVGAEAVYHIVEDARRELKMFFYTFENTPNTLDGFDSRLMSTPGQTIFDILDRTVIGVKMTSPCLDLEGEEKDGSIVGPLPNSICISAKTTGEKLAAGNARVETMALIVHELSHLMGFNETEAIALQESVANYYNERGIRASDSERYKNRQDYSLFLWVYAPGISDWTSVENWDYLCAWVKAMDVDFSNETGNFFPNFALRPFVLLPASAWRVQTLRQISKRISFMRMPICGRAPTEGQQSERNALITYDRAFSNLPAQTTIADLQQQYSQALGHTVDRPNYFEDVTVSRIDSFESLRSEVFSICDFLHQFSVSMAKLAEPPLVSTY